MLGSLHTALGIAACDFICIVIMDLKKVNDNKQVLHIKDIGYLQLEPRTEGT
jgi:hypothetical protein